MPVDNSIPDIAAHPHQESRSLASEAFACRRSHDSGYDSSVLSIRSAPPSQAALLTNWQPT